MNLCNLKVLGILIHCFLITEIIKTKTRIFTYNNDRNLGKSKVLHVDYKNKAKSTVLNTLDIKGA